MSIAEKVFSVGFKKIFFWTIPAVNAENPWQADIKNLKVHQRQALNKLILIKYSSNTDFVYFM